MWLLGYGKLAVVPSVNLEYSSEAEKKIKSLKGYVSDFVGRKDENYKIEERSNAFPTTRILQGSALAMILSRSALASR